MLHSRHLHRARTCSRSIQRNYGRVLKTVWTLGNRGLEQVTDAPAESVACSKRPPSSRVVCLVHLVSLVYSVIVWFNS